MEHGEDILKTIGTPEQAAHKLKLEYESYLDNNATLNASPIKPLEQNQISLKEETTSDTMLSSLCSIIVEAQNTKIIVKREPIAYPEVDFEPIKNIDDFSISKENHCFHVVHRMKKMWFFNPFGFQKTRELILKIPETFSGNVSLETCNSSIAIHGFHHLNSLWAKTSNSKITAEQLTANEIELTTSNSSIHANHIFSENLIAHTSNSKIHGENIDCSEEVTLSTSNGTIEVLHLCGKNIDLHTSNAPIKGSITGSIMDYNITTEH